MTDNNHPITPPPELVEQWECEYHHMTYGPDLSIFISEKAARWGADQELEACCEWLKTIAMTKPWDTVAQLALELRAARRPKPPSLKEQGIALIDKIQGNKEMWDIRDLDVVRRALESLPN